MNRTFFTEEEAIVGRVSEAPYLELSVPACLGFAFGSGRSVLRTKVGLPA